MSDNPIDVVVIGSGFGGSVVSARLAEAGVNVVLLERGPWWDTVPTRSCGIKDRTPFPRGRDLLTRFVRSVNSRWLPNGRVTLSRRGLFEFYYYPGIQVMCSSGVGGGSQIYSGLHRRPPAEDYWNGRVAGLSEENMRPHGEAFLARMKSTVPGPDNAPPNRTSDIFGNNPYLEPTPPDPLVKMGFLFPKDPKNPQKIVDEHGIERFEIDYRQDDNGMFGSPSGAKTTLDVSYLAPAMKKGLEVRDLCEALSVTPIKNSGARYRVEIRDHRRKRNFSLLANNVVLAAGTMNTLRIMLHSRSRRDGLNNMPNLGHHFGGNGDMRSRWNTFNDGVRYIDRRAGMPARGGIVLRDAPLPKVSIYFSFTPNIDSFPFPRWYIERIRKRANIVGMGPDAMDGVVSLENGKFHVDFNPNNSPIYAKIRETMIEMGRLIGQKTTVKDIPATVHPMGGACVGDESSGGVVDANGEVYGNPGLFVADAAALPAPVGGPPTQTIATWAENVAFRFLERRGLV